MWVRKTTEEIITSTGSDQHPRVNFFVPIVVAAVLTGFAILNLAFSPVESAIFFFTAFMLGCNVKAFLHDSFSDWKTKVDRLDPDSTLFCPDCHLLRFHLALCPDCRGPLEPMAHWKWVEAPRLRSPNAPTASTPTVEATCRIPGNVTLPNREISISLPISRRKLAAKIGITHSHLLKDLLDHDLFAAVNPRLADREALTHLGRKHRVIFRFS